MILRLDVTCRDCLILSRVQSKIKKRWILKDITSEVLNIFSKDWRRKHPETRLFFKSFFQVIWWHKAQGPQFPWISFCCWYSFEETSPSPFQLLNRLISRQALATLTTSLNGHLDTHPSHLFLLLPPALLFFLLSKLCQELVLHPGKSSVIFAQDFAHWKWFDPTDGRYTPLKINQFSGIFFQEGPAQRQSQDCDPAFVSSLLSESSVPLSHGNSNQGYHRLSSSWLVIPHRKVSGSAEHLLPLTHLLSM